MDKLDQVMQYTKEKMLGEVAAHDVSHAIRVMEIARHIGVDMDHSLDLEVIEVAGLTHDIIDRKVTDDMEGAAKALSDQLLVIGYSQEQVAHVIEIIENMSYSSGRIPDSLEGKIVQDADRLEAVGAIAIARTFAYGGKKSRRIYEEGDGESSIAHFYDKLLRLKDMMHTDMGKKIALSRHAFMEAYLDQFYREWKLEDVLQSQ